MNLTIANIITSFRIFLSVLLLFFPVFSLPFYILYLLCGVSDMIDGTVARHTNTSSEFGAKLDTAADFLFTVISLSRFLPVLPIPKWVWIWTAIITAIKIGTVLEGFLRLKTMPSLHTFLNKATGLMLFLLPLTRNFPDLKCSCAVVCAMATVSAVQEGYCIRKLRTSGR